MPRWPDPSNKIKCIDCTPDGRLKPFIDEAMYNWNQSGVELFGDIDWVPNDEKWAAYLQDENAYPYEGSVVRVGDKRLGGYLGLMYSSTSVLGIDAAFVIVDVYALQEEHGWAEQQVRSCVAHEIGHVVGLGHNDSGSSIMNTALNIGLYGTPQPIDLENMRRLYA